MSRFDLEKLGRQMELMNRFMKPSYLRLAEEIERATRPLQGMPPVPGEFAKVAKATAQAMNHLTIDQSRYSALYAAVDSSKFVANIATMQQSWINDLAYAQQSMARVAEFIDRSKIDISAMSLQMAASERFIAGVSFSSIAERFESEAMDVAALRDSIAGATISFRDLTDSWASVANFSAFPSYVVLGATREIYATNYALRAIPGADQARDIEERVEDTDRELLVELEEEVSNSVGLLNAVGPELARAYLGAREALDAANIDRQRHVLISLRELWGHLLRRLAPDEYVSSWVASKERREGLLHGGRPTRRARVLYVCREIDSPPFSEFLVQDTNALVRLIRIFDRVHELEANLSEKQLKALMLKNDSWLKYILEIHNGD